MKRYGIVDERTGEQVLPYTFECLGTAHHQAKRMGEGLATVTWVGHFGLPSVAAVFRDDGQLETVCLYPNEAHRICNLKNEQDPGRYEVRNVMLNTAYGE